MASTQILKQYFAIKVNSTTLLCTIGIVQYCKERFSVQDCAVRDGYRLEGRVLLNTRYNRGNLAWRSLGRAQARCTALFTLCQRYRVFVSRQPDSKSARTLKDLAFDKTREM